MIEFILCAQCNKPLISDEEVFCSEQCESVYLLDTDTSEPFCERVFGNDGERPMEDDDY